MTLGVARSASRAATAAAVSALFARLGLEPEATTLELQGLRQGLGFRRAAATRLAAAQDQRQARAVL